MKPELQAKYLQFISSKKNKEEGFTLIELLVVVIIIGVLAAVALPNLLGQVAKGRQAEAKNNLGSVNRAQQASRLEDQYFVQPTDLATKTSWQYYDSSLFTGWGTGAASTNASNQSFMSYGVLAATEYTSDIKDYNAAVQSDGTVFGAVICEAPDETANTGSPTAGATPDAVACDAGDKTVK